MNMKRILLALAIGVPATAAVAFVAERAWAYTESTIRSRVPTVAIPGIIGPTGCILQLGGLTHSNSTSPLAVNASANTSGLTAMNYQLCNPLSGPGIFKFIKGRIHIGLLKLRSTGTGSNPDDYYYCKQVFYNQQNWVTQLNARYEWSTPPCGAGYYAQVVCLQDVSAVLTDGVIALGGTYSATDMKTGCNVSPNWHPAVDTGEVLGPPVKLR